MLAAMSDAQEAIVKINSAKDSIGTLAEDAGKVSGRAAEAKAAQLAAEQLAASYEDGYKAAKYLMGEEE